MKSGEWVIVEKEENKKKRRVKDDGGPERGQKSGKTEKEGGLGFEKWRRGKMAGGKSKVEVGKVWCDRRVRGRWKKREGCGTKIRNRQNTPRRQTLLLRRLPGLPLSVFLFLSLLILSPFEFRFAIIKRTIEESSQPSIVLCAPSQLFIANAAFLPVAKREVRCLILFFNIISRRFSYP